MNALVKALFVASLGYLGYANLQVAQSGLEAADRFQQELTLKAEMQNIARVMVGEYVTSERLPMEDFSGWLRENMCQDTGTPTRDYAADPWGTLYHFRLDGPGFVIKSAGPDQQWKTSDDIEFPQSLLNVDAKERIEANLARQAAEVQAAQRRNTPATPASTTTPASATPQPVSTTGSRPRR